ncbi:MAG: glycosyltransferase, partial [bacterium]|nr:glycosyltransferase [bacterium]
MKKGISVVIFAHNDQDRLETCIKSVNSFTKNILLLDIGSTDKTSIIAEQLGATVHKTNFVQYVELVREEGIGLADTEWVLLLDADEALSLDLSNEIQDMISGP